MNAAMLGLFLAASAACAADDNHAALREQSRHALRRGIEFFRSNVAIEGGYLWQYSEDLSKREGEGVVESRTRVWVQPPGTPAVGMAYLEAYRATRESACLEAARDTARALVRGQLQSGGWTYYIDFAAADRKKTAYRQGDANKGRNVSTLDDDTTQSALRFLLQADEALNFKDAEVHECVLYGLRSLLAAQFPNGAWSQGFEQSAEPGAPPVKKATIPDSWPRTWPNQGYWTCYTLNDNVLVNVVATLFEAERVGSVSNAPPELRGLAERARQSAGRAGDFLVLAQMAEPQPAWAQQYDTNMQPVWARKFEPPAITGGESQSAMRLLLDLYRHTGRRDFLEPIPRALAYLRRSRLPDGGLARFYELVSNKPLYFTKEYVLTYDDSDVPTHYAFKVGDGTEAISRNYERLLKAGPEPKGESTVAAKVTPTLVKQVRDIIAAQDSEGRWLNEGGLRYHSPKDPSLRVIRAATFIKNVETLSRYLSATSSGSGN